MLILIVEDDENIAKLIESTLMIGGYKSHICHNGAQAADIIKNNKFDLILLDIMLPDMDGFEVIKHIDTAKTPVIFLTAMQNVADKVKGLRLGAEDYIVKPFEAMELLARIEVVFRRCKKEINVLEYNDIYIDIEKHTVKKSGKEISLTPKEFSLLVFFTKNVDIALSKERLLSSVWGYNFMGETRTVDTHVQQLRKKLSLNNSLITIPKLGYRLESR